MAAAVAQGAAAGAAPVAAVAVGEAVVCDERPKSLSSFSTSISAAVSCTFASPSSPPPAAAAPFFLGGAFFMSTPSEALASERFWASVRLRFGDSFSASTPPRSSPTSRMAESGFGLNATCVTLLLRTTFWSHMASCLFSARSNTCTLPSLVTAAKTLEEYGAHSTSPTALPRSKDMSGCRLWWSHNLTVQSADAERKTRG
mmetsp:Transcript_71613/g.104922  ORF Transcript_71613/g.104922 Transcript_71613/m.104922 type:complete len:201 (-) Transcript_71613:1587-2189(-)